MPEDHDPVPYSDQFATDRIFTKKIKQRQQLGWTNQPPANMNNLKPGEIFVASFSGCGAMWRRFVYVDPNPQQLRNQMALRDSENRNVTELFLENDDTGQLNFNIAVPTDSYMPHGDQLVCGRTFSTKYANASWVWLDGVPSPTSGKESRFTFTFPGSWTIAACVFKVVGWRGGKYNESYEVVFDAADATRSKSTVNIPRSDYYSVFYVPSLGTDPPAPDNNFDSGRGVQVSIASYCSVLCHVQVRSAWKNMTQLGPGCIRAASLRMTEMAAPLNIQGECAVADTRENGTWWEMYTTGNGGQNSVFKVVNNYRDAYVGPLRLGGYAFALPKSMDEFKPREYCVVDYDTGAIVDVFFDLEDPRNVQVFSANTINNGTNDGLTGLGADCWLTVPTLWDGTCDNDWVDMWYPNVSFETWMHSLEVMRGVPRAMSNKWHIKELMGTLFKRGVLAARKYAGPLIRVAGRAAAEYLAGRSPLGDEGIKLLQSAYNIGDHIASTLANGQ